MRIAWIQRRAYTEAGNLIQIRNGTFFREHPSSVSASSTTNPPLFPDLTFELPATRAQDVGKPIRKKQHWAVIGNTGTSTFFDALRGVSLCLPPKARTYPYLSSDDVARKDPRLRIPSRAIQYVGFASGGSLGGAVRGAYLSARYESRREETDWSVIQYLKGETELNPAAQELRDTITDKTLLDQVIQDLRLQKLVDMPVSNLSNGQTRRARIAKALLSQPELLLLDEPFMGLDPYTTLRLSPLLQGLAYRSAPLLMLALRPQDPIPEWITDLVVLGDNHTVALQGNKAQVLFSLSRWAASDQAQKTGIPSRYLIPPKANQILRGAYGIPLLGVGDSITSEGIKKYEVNDEVLNSVGEELFSNGLTNPAMLSEEQQEAWREAEAKPEHDRTPQDWFVLTTSLPTSFNASKQEQSLPLTESRRDDPVPWNVANTQTRRTGEPLIELNNIVIKYGDKTVLGHPPPQPGHDKPGLNLTISQGTRIALLGPNGSGKTTLLALLTSDHPHSYSLPIKFFGRTRLPELGKPGLSLWEIQSRIGHSAPEVHSFFPKNLSIRRVLESAWSETYSTKAVMNEERRTMVDMFLKWWEPELRQAQRSHPDQESATARSLEWAQDQENHRFGVLPFGIQRLLLFLRAIIKEPDIIILDEAFSGLPSTMRDKAMDWLQHGNQSSSISEGGGARFTGLTDKQGLVVVSHVREEVPDCIDEFVRLPSEEEALETGKGVQMGTSDSGWIKSEEGWNKVWGL